MANVVCFGEVLWDLFPNHKKIGGAPLNVALRLASFGHKVSMISAVGKDENGEVLLDYIKNNNVQIGQIQTTSKFDTGVVDVFINNKGSASYVIKYPSAWDKIELTQENKARVAESDAMVFGSLITRDKTSKNTLLGLLEVAQYKIFDLNLRPPHYDYETISYLMKKADFIKFNDDELYKICKQQGSKYHNLEQNLKFISEKTNTKHICVTKGEHGAVLLYNGAYYYNSGYQINLVDTVGAGDSFLGTLISQLLNKEHPQKAIDMGCAVGALVAQSEGANPNLSKEEIEKFMNPQ